MNTIGFLLDMDGLVFDTQGPFHATAEALVCKMYDVQVDPDEITHRFAGISTKKVFAELVPGCNPELLNAKKWEIMHEMLRTQELKLLPGIAYMCHTLAEHKIPFAIASASSRTWIENCLTKQVNFSSAGFDAPYAKEATSLSYYFNNRYVSAEECENGKPAPDVFLKAKELLEKEYGPVKRWIIAGDGRSDVQAGLAAKMEVIYLSSSDYLYNTVPKVTRWDTSSQMVRQVLRLIEQ